MEERFFISYPQQDVDSCFAGILFAGWYRITDMEFKLIELVPEIIECKTGDMGDNRWS